MYLCIIFISFLVSFVFAEEKKDEITTIENMSFSPKVITYLGYQTDEIIANRPLDKYKFKEEYCEQLIKINYCKNFIAGDLILLSMNYNAMENMESYEFTLNTSEQTFIGKLNAKVFNKNTPFKERYQTIRLKDIANDENEINLSLFTENFKREDIADTLKRFNGFIRKYQAGFKVNPIGKPSFLHIFSGRNSPNGLYYLSFKSIPEKKSLQLKLRHYRIVEKVNLENIIPPLISQVEFPHHDLKICFSDINGELEKSLLPIVFQIDELFPYRLGESFNSSSSSDINDYDSSIEVISSSSSSAESTP